VWLPETQPEISFLILKTADSNWRPEIFAQPIWREYQTQRSDRLQTLCELRAMIVTAEAYR